MLLERRLAYSNDQWSMAGRAAADDALRAPRGGFAHDPSQIVTDTQCRGEWWRPIDRALARFPARRVRLCLAGPPAAVTIPALTRGLTPIWRDGDERAVPGRTERGDVSLAAPA